jgi:putative serine protease PepD
VPPAPPVPAPAAAGPHPQEASDARTAPGPQTASNPQNATGQTAPGQAAPGPYPAPGPYAGQAPPPWPPRYDAPPPPPPRPPGDPAARRYRPGRVLAAVALLVVTAVGSAVGGGVVALQLEDRGGAVTASPVVVDSAGAPTSQLAKVAAAVQPSVVSIAVRGAGSSGEGSGVVVRSDGTILTNNHVVEAAATGGQITVTFADGRTGTASIVGRAPSDDLAVIRVSGVSDVTPATLGSNGSLHVGDTVLAIGSPLGLEGSVTSGIVSATHRTITLGGGDRQAAGSTVVQAVQTDAAINPGNSGGPLVDGQGRVVGITTAIATLGSQPGQSGSIGLGFAIPIDSAKRIADALARGEQPRHAALGVRVALDQTGGARLSGVDAGSAASKAGLRAGDVVTAVDAMRITDGRDLSATIRTHAPGDEVELTYTRGGSTHHVTVTLGTARG